MMRGYARRRISMIASSYFAKFGLMILARAFRRQALPPFADADSAARYAG